MTLITRHTFRVPRRCVLFLLAALATLPLQGQEPHVGLTQDWSTRHVILTNAASPAVAAAASRDPRTWINGLLHRPAYLFSTSSRIDGLLEKQVKSDETAPSASGWQGTYSVNRRSRIDWAVSLGPTGGMARGETPAKFGFRPTGAPDCTNDFVVYTINATPGVGTQANIVAFNKLYSGPGANLCGAAPAFMWAYAVGNGRIFLSPVLSLDGKKIAFVEASNPRPTFNVLQWVSGQGTNATGGAVAPGGGSSVTSLDFSNTTVAGCVANPVAADSNSSPFVDYDNDVAYVGANNGVLYRIKNVFNGTPTLDYCITVNAGRALTSPVYDSVTKKVFVSDGRSVFGYTPGAASFTAAGSVTVAGTAGSIILAPIIDVSSALVYVFSTHNLTNTNEIVSQMPESLTTHVDAPIGPASGGSVLDGDFDNNYYQNGPATGSLYACGTQTASNTRPALYTLTFLASGMMSPVPAMSNDRNINGAANPQGTCSPLLEFFDGTTDRLFVGTGAAGATTGANLVTMWNITSRIVSNAATPTATATNELGGTSAFTVDNNSPLPQASSTYFGTLASGAAAPCGAGLFCAVKLTQSALQ